MTENDSYGRLLEKIGCSTRWPTPVNIPSTVCDRNSLSYAGTRSARLAEFIFRLGIRSGTRLALGKSIGHILRRMPAISRAYLNALEAERAS